MNSENYVFGYGAAAVAIMAKRTADSHAAFFLSKLQPGMRVLDIGCGPGTVTLGLAEAANPGEVIGAELSLKQTKKVATEAERRSLNLKFECADIYALPYETDSFDAVFLSAVIGNLQRPVDAMNEVYRVLAAGGVVGVKEFDHSANINYPPREFQTKVNELYTRLRIHNGHDPDSGRKVRSYLTQAGFANVDAAATYQNTTPPSGVTGDPTMESIVRDEWGPKFVKFGWASAKEIDDWIAQSKAYTTDDGDFSALAWIEALGFKPG